MKTKLLLATVPPVTGRTEPRNVSCSHIPSPSVAWLKKRRQRPVRVTIWVAPEAASNFEPIIKLRPTKKS